MTHEERVTFKEKAGLYFSPSEISAHERRGEYLGYSDGEVLLCNAIIMQATNDYERAKKELIRATQNGRRSQVLEKHRRTVEEIVQFYHSKWYDYLSQIATFNVCKNFEKSVVS